MSFSICIHSKEDLNLLADRRDIKEVIIGCRELSRSFDCSKEDFYEISHLAKTLNLKRVLCYDALICERDFNRVMSFFEIIDQDSYDYIRVQDLGVFEQLIELGHNQLQLILETAFHNKEAIKVILKNYGEVVSKIILSYELTLDLIKEYIEIITKENIGVELLCYGPILLFYSPRKLLSASLMTEKQVVANSLESPHKGYEILENLHGTFMYHLKDLFIYEQLKNLSIDKRIDPLFTKDGIEKFFDWLDNSNERYPKQDRKFTQGYLAVNKTDVLFPKLKNTRLNRVDENFVGTVLENKKGSHIAVRVEGKRVKKEDELYFINPEGKIINHTIQQLYDLSFNDISSAENQDIFLIKSLKKITPKTKVYLN